MKNWLMYLQISFSSIATFLTWFFGSDVNLLFVLIAFSFVDFITGVMAAIIEKKLSSKECVKGAFKKFIIFLLVGIGNILDVYVLNANGSIRTLIIFFYLSNEGISILENACILGLPVPQKLKNILSQLNSEKNN